MIDTPTRSRRRPGSPLMVKGGPSLNPLGRPRKLGQSLAHAIRARVSPDYLVTLALDLIRSETANSRARLGALEMLARRGYPALAVLAANTEAA